MRLALLAALALGAPASAQLQIHAAVTSGAAGDTAGMRRQAVATAPDRQVWVGPVVLDLPPASIQTVGLELDADGATALSLWLSPAAAASFATLTEASVGRALAVVWDGRVLTAPVVQSPIRNGMVRVTGLDHREAERLADALRQATDADVPARELASPPARPLDLPRRPPLRLDPPTSTPSYPDTPASPAAPRQPAGGAADAALAFVRAVAARDWRAVADGLHPDALRAARPGALDVMRLDGGTVVVRDGRQEGSFIAADALGVTPRAETVAGLSDRDLGVLYLAALDVLGVWGAPAPARAVIGEVRDGDRIHVLLQASGRTPGVSDVSIVTLARDGAGVWRPLLTQPLGF